MEMDDPWGSPWADELQTSNPLKPTKDDFAVKPTTPVKAASLALERKINSPWDDADDDGSGEWAEGPAEGGNGLGLGVADGWESDAEHGLGYGLVEGHSNTLSIPWNDGIVTPGDGTSKLAPSLLPKASILRQPSPDPWAVGTSREDEDADAHTPQLEQRDEGFTSREPIVVTRTESEVSEDLVPVLAVDEVLAGAIEDKHGISTIQDINDAVEESKKSTVENVQNSTPAKTTGRNGDTQEAGHVSSRPSSSPSEHSHHNELALDSPRTSLDEEPKRPSMPRKVSSKVQELVQHFDGLAQKEDSSELIAGKGDEQQPISKGGEEEEEEIDEFGDFGDFEDVKSDIEELLDERKADSHLKSPIVEGSNARPREPVTEQEEPRANFVRKSLGSVEFAVDTSVFDRLYSGTEPKTPSEKLSITDVVPHDSFSSTEERKSWYRISRYGTMRKYNTGDDENYVRVNWAQSQVRADTLKVVARWIEEDRISGRVVLGGASKGSSIFGWNDPKAAPMPLAHAFGVKNGKQKAMRAGDEPVVEIPREWPKGLVRTRSTSRSPSLSKSQRKNSTKSITSEDTKSKTQLPAANFGWNAATQAMRESKSQSPVHEKKPSGSSFSSPFPAAKTSPAPQQASSRISSPLPVELGKRVPAMNGKGSHPHSIAHTSISVAPTLTTSQITNDDDDWGELVSSPSTNIPPVIPQVIPPSTETQHKATRSLGSAFPSTTTIPPVIENPISSPTPIETDTWAKGLEGLLTPQIANFTATSIPNKLGENTFTTPNNVSNIFGSAKQNSNQFPAATSIDPWKSVDFSFFEATGNLTSNSTPVPKTKTVPSKSGKFTAPAATSVPHRNQRSREEIEQDKIVKTAIRGLPDLSYMLRR